MDRDKTSTTQQLPEALLILIKTAQSPNVKCLSPKSFPLNSRSDCDTKIGNCVNILPKKPTFFDIIFLSCSVRYNHGLGSESQVFHADCITIQTRSVCTIQEFERFFNVAFNKSLQISICPIIGRILLKNKFKTYYRVQLLFNRVRFTGYIDQVERNEKEQTEQGLSFIVT